MLNSDGAVKRNGLVSCGGLIRNGQGAWVIGFNKRLRTMSVMEKELWALKEGLQIAADLHHTPLVVEMDAMQLIKLLHTQTSHTHGFDNLLHVCRCLMWSLGMDDIRHIY